MAYGVQDMKRAREAAGVRACVRMRGQTLCRSGGGSVVVVVVAVMQ